MSTTPCSRLLNASLADGFKRKPAWPEPKRVRFADFMREALSGNRRSLEGDLDVDRVQDAVDEDGRTVRLAHLLRRSKPGLDEELGRR